MGQKPLFIEKDSRNSFRSMFLGIVRKVRKMLLTWEFDILCLGQSFYSVVKKFPSFFIGIFFVALFFNKIFCGRIGYLNLALLLQNFKEFNLKQIQNQSKHSPSLLGKILQSAARPQSHLRKLKPCLGIVAPDWWKEKWEIDEVASQYQLIVN